MIMVTPRELSGNGIEKAYKGIFMIFRISELKGGMELISAFSP